jgi:hypothetical protein
MHSYLLVYASVIIKLIDAVRIQLITISVDLICIHAIFWLLCSLEVILRAEAVESCQPGDKCGFIGTLIVVPHVAALIGPGVATESGRPGRTADGNEATDGGVRGLKALGTRDLSYRLAFLACAVVPSAENKTSAYWNTVLHRSGNDLDDPDVDPDETAENLDESLSSSAGNQANSAKRVNELAIATMKKQLSDAEWARIYAMSRDPRIYSNLCASLFPSVHGNEEVKQGIILMLFGGVPKQTPDGTRLRGDINVCLVGDPSTAKSQFLKYVFHSTPILSSWVFETDLVYKYIDKFHFEFHCLFEVVPEFVTTAINSFFLLSFSNLVWKVKRKLISAHHCNFLDVNHSTLWLANY